MRLPSNDYGHEGDTVTEGLLAGRVRPSRSDLDDQFGAFDLHESDTGVLVAADGLGEDGIESFDDGLMDSDLGPDLGLDLGLDLGSEPDLEFADADER